MTLEIVFVVALAVVGVVVAGVVLGRRRAVIGGDCDSDSISFVGSVLGALFTVVLAFYVVFAWQQGDDISSDARAESDSVVDAYWQAENIPEPARSQVQDLLRGYVRGVAEGEWTALADGGTDPTPAVTLRAVRAAFAAVPATDDVLVSTRDNALADVRQIDESHRSRVDRATDTDTFNNVLLAGTLLGGALMIAFPLMVGLSARPANLAAMGVLTLTVGATAVISILLAHPMSGPFAVDPDAFRDALAEMRSARP